MREYTSVIPLGVYLLIHFIGIIRRNNNFHPLSYIYFNITLPRYQGPVPITYFRMPIRQNYTTPRLGDMTRCSKKQKLKKRIQHAEYPCKEANYFQFPVNSESDPNFTFRPNHHRQTDTTNYALDYHYAHVRKFGSPDDIGTTGQLTPFLASLRMLRQSIVRRRVSRPAHMCSAPFCLVHHALTYF